MAVTAQTNTDLASIASFLLCHDDFVVCGHVSPDGDCIGSQLGLAAALRAAGKHVACVLARDDGFEKPFAFLPGAEGLVPAIRYEGPCKTFVAVDVPTRERIGDAVALLDQSEASVTIDHHAVDSTMTELVYVDPDAAAAALLVWQIAGLLGVDRQGAIAQCCYTGVVTDTGRFQYQNTDAFALRSAADMVEAGADVSLVARKVFQSRSIPSLRLESRAVERMRFGLGGGLVMSWVVQEDFDELGASRPDAEQLVDALRSIAGVRVACLLREQDGDVRGNLRAKDDSDVSVVARSLGGGGHVAAAGFTLRGCGIEEARVQVWDALVEAFGPEFGAEGEGAEVAGKAREA